MSKLSDAILSNLRQRCEMKKRFLAGDKTVMSKQISNFEAYQRAGSMGSHDVTIYCPTNTEKDKN